MIIDDSIVQSYLNGSSCETYQNHWIYSASDRGRLFEAPDFKDRDWVSALHQKIIKEINAYTPRNAQTVKALFPDFDERSAHYTVMLVVGLPDPYDAMTLAHDGKEYMIFDLIRFGRRALEEENSSHGLLTHELIHMCLHEKYPVPSGLSYLSNLDYITFDEGFAHSLPFPSDFKTFHFDDDLNQKYRAALFHLRAARAETDAAAQQRLLIRADTGKYWDKFGAISGKLYLLKHKDRLIDLYQAGWRGFSAKIADDNA